MSSKLAKLLAEERVISAPQLSEANSQTQSGQKKSPVIYLIESKQISDNKLFEFLTKRFGLVSINLNKFEIRPEVLRLMGSDLVKKFRVIPIQSKGQTLVVATWDPTAIERLDELKFTLKVNIEPVLVTYTAFESAITRYYGMSATFSDAFDAIKKEEDKERKEIVGKKEESTVIGDIQVQESHDIDPGSSDASEAPVIAIVNSIFREALQRKVSDIHIEPYEKTFRVRMRVDGILSEVTQIPITIKRAVVARIKIMSRMDIAESRLPQDGRIKLKVGTGDIDLRVSTVPTVYGEKVVMRILNKNNLQLDFMKLGFDESQLEAFKRGISAANGMVLVTGPTGSGKTTTLYSALSELNKISDNISTVEDPVEYNLDGVNQIQTNKDIGLTFAAVLKTLLRQDPDIVLVGEIRDYETAEVAVQAALTGHLVLSTLHTNDAPSTITRLMNMGLEPFLVTASVNTIIAQRLVRKICVRCKSPSPIPKDQLIKIGFSEQDAAKVIPMIGKGCSDCGKTGYKGRVSVYEIMEFTPRLKELVLGGASSIELKKRAIEEGMRTLRSSALSKVAAGITTLEEAVTNTMADG